MSAIENARAALAAVEASRRANTESLGFDVGESEETAALRDLLAHVEATTPTNDEREAITAAIDAILNPFDQGTATQERLVLAAAEKWANRQEPRPITDEMVEAAIKAYWQDPARNRMRAALEAAEATR